MSEKTAGGSSSTQDNNDSEIYPGFKNVKDFTQNGLRLLMENIRDSNGLPIGQKWDYYTSFPSFKKVMNSEGKRILHLINLILRHQGVQGNVLRRDDDEKFELLVDANDRLFERVGNTLDEIMGIRKNPEPVLVEATGKKRAVSGSWNKGVSSKTDAGAAAQFEPQSVRLLTAKNIERPQSKFRDKIDNSNSAWEPRIKEKPNAIKPLAILLETNEEGECFSHPYEFELDRFTPSEEQLKASDPIEPKPIDEVPLIMVEKQEQIAPLVEDLLKYKTIAVDLEHHSYRSFQGFTCLLQISTGDTDYLIDTLSLRSDLHVLNEAFTNPKILKVFHGADSDIHWLQRDLSLYIVNMFDTHQAAKILNFAGLSLSFLLKHYCNISAEKHFQMADWRIRPLPEELKQYARSDTHYLIYIYEKMRNGLLEAGNGQTNLLQAVYQRSTETCKRRYSKTILTDDSHMMLYRKSKKMFTNQQMYGLQQLFQWRDRIAREEDESIGYVLPNHMLLHISEMLPREIQGILSCCNPIPPLVRQHLLELHQIILRAREQPLVKPVVEEELRQRPVAETWAKLNLESPLCCPHDMSFQLDFRDDLPTLLEPIKNGDVDKNLSQNLNVRASLPLYSNNSFVNVPQTHLVKEQPKIDLGYSLTTNNDTDDGSQKSKAKDLLEKVNFMSPFECYKKVRPYLDHLEQEKLRKHQEEQSRKAAADQAQSISTDLTFEERIVRMQEDIKKMTNENANSEQLSAAPKTEDLPLFVPSKAFKRKTAQLRGRPFEEGEPQPKSKKAEKQPPKAQKKGQNRKEDNHQAKTASKSGTSKFEPFDYKQANYSRFQSGDQKKKNQEVQSNFETKKRGKNAKTSALKVSKGLDGDGPKRGRGRGRGRGRR